MNNSYFKLGALGCCVLYLILYLFLPVVSIAFVGLGVSPSQIMSVSFWPWLVVIGGVAMGVCALLLPAKPAAIVSLAGAFLPLITFLTIKGQITGAAGGVANMIGAGSVVNTVAGALLNIGLGAILAMLCGFGSAVLCFLSEGQGRATTRTPGLGTDTGDEW